ncbi:hypothetical protein JTF08_11980 [Micrococcaceae bacterium RIT802]|nr:hypothetical protein [Micrococcaceae bacterium RIT 802]
MKVLAFIFSLLVLSGLCMGGVLLVITQTPDAPLGLSVLAAGAIQILVAGPVLLGAMLAYWNFKESADGQRYFHRFILVTVVLEVLAAIAVVLYAVLAPAPGWIPLLAIGTCVALTVTAWGIGPRIRLHEDRHRVAKTGWTPVPRVEIRRKTAIIATTWGAGFILSLVGIPALFLALDADGFGVGRALLVAVQFAFLAAAVAALVVAFPLLRHLREIARGDFGLAKKIGKVVLSRKSQELDAQEQRAAAEYAAAFPVASSFQLAYFALLYAALCLQQVQGLSMPEGRVFSAVLLAFLLLVFLGYLPYYLRQLKRARRYAHDHADLLPEPG